MRRSVMREPETVAMIVFGGGQTRGGDTVHVGLPGCWAGKEDVECGAVASCQTKTDSGRFQPLKEERKWNAVQSRK